MLVDNLDKIYFQQLDYLVSHLKSTPIQFTSASSLAKYVYIIQGNPVTGNTQETSEVT